jgi:hypothetical protein
MRRALLCLCLTACPKPAASPGPTWGPVLDACCYGDPDTGGADTAAPAPTWPRPRWPLGQGADTGADTSEPTDTGGAP